MNSGKVYHTLLNKINNNLICIIQEYNRQSKTNENFLPSLQNKTYWLNCDLDLSYIKQMRIHHILTFSDYWDYRYKKTDL